MTKPRLLDAYCGAGGCTKGYQEAGFYVVGVDINPQPNYCGGEFFQGDAVEFIERYGRDFDAVHASPPCQFGSVLTPTTHKANHKNLIPATRAALIETGRPFIVENVEGVREHLINPVKLCGSMFGLGVWRHRYFELSWNPMVLTPYCDHSGVPVLISGSPRRNGCRKEPSSQQRRDAMDTQWMSRIEMDQAIPPAYTAFLGEHLMEHLSTLLVTV